MFNCKKTYSCTLRVVTKKKSKRLPKDWRTREQWKDSHLFQSQEEFQHLYIFVTDRDDVPPSIEPQEAGGLEVD